MKKPEPKIGDRVLLDFKEEIYDELFTQVWTVKSVLGESVVTIVCGAGLKSELSLTMNEFMKRCEYYSKVRSDMFFKYLTGVIKYKNEHSADRIQPRCFVHRIDGTNDYVLFNSFTGTTEVVTMAALYERLMEGVDLISYPRKVYNALVMNDIHFLSEHFHEMCSDEAEGNLAYADFKNE